MHNVLICYYGEYPARTSNIDHLYSFGRYSGERCFYLDVNSQRIPNYLSGIPFDLVIFHTNFLSARWDLKDFQRLVEKVRPLMDNSAVKIALPQDEFFGISVVCDFINEFGIKHVFSVAPPSEWKKIYRTVDFERVSFHSVLTGYLERRTLTRINRSAENVSERDLDIGYRAWRAEPWLGRHGFLKTRLAEIFEQESAARQIKADISTRAEDTLHGDGWYKFLFRSKYTIGVEGGASILDWDGSIREQTNSFISRHPDATFEEIEKACFPNLDGSLDLFAISPRHLEACATRTCQILIEGEYNGALSAGKHYIELKRDFSNLEEVFSKIKDDRLREEIIENAYRDVVESGHYHYEKFVKQVLETSLPKTIQEKAIRHRGINVWLFWALSRMANLFAWLKCFIKGVILLPLYEKVLTRLPTPIETRVRLFARKVFKK